MGLEGFGERLKAAIKDSKYSQKEISENLRINQDTITNYVKEKYLPKADSLYDICTLLGISADWLLFGERPEEKNPSVSDYTSISDLELELIMSYRELSDRDKRDVYAYIKMKMDLEMNPIHQSLISSSGRSDTGEEVATIEIA